MKNILIILIMLIVGIIVFFTIFDKEDKYNIEFKEDSLYALEYLGYQYEVDNEEIDFYSLPGDEYYFIVPRYSDMSIKIYENFIDGNSELIMSSSTAKPFIIKGNQSDIFSNIVIELTSSDGKVSSFSPYISLKDGTVVVNEEGILVEGLLDN